MMVPKTSIIPPGGWHFIDRSGGEPVRIDGYSEEDVVAKVLKYRMGNSLPPGNPLQEYRDWMCGTWPHFCTGAEAPVQGQLSNGEHISRRVSTWMSVFIRNYRSSENVSPAEADRRAAICSKCPLNIEYATSGCGTCLQNIQQLAFIYKANRQTQYDSVLRACSATGQHNESAVWSKDLPPADPSTLPSHCWRK